MYFQLCKMTINHMQSIIKKKVEEEGEEEEVFNCLFFFSNLLLTAAFPFQKKKGFQLQLQIMDIY